MRSRVLLGWGVALTVLGLAGVVVVWVLGPSVNLPPGDGTFTSDGQRIYYTGLGADGRAIPRTVAGGRGTDFAMMGGNACVDCHGEDGRGGFIGMMFRSIEVPDIRYSALTGPHSEDGTRRSGWSDSDVKRAIRDGVEPDGERLKPPMPRWDMTDGEVTDVIDYLKELDAR